MSDIVGVLLKCKKKPCFYFLSEKKKIIAIQFMSQN